MNSTAKQVGIGAAILAGLYWIFSGSDNESNGLSGLSGYFETNNIKTLDDLKKQYYKLAKKYHPDTDTGSKEDFQALANEYEKLFKKLLNGSTLSSEEKENEIALDANLRKVYESIMHLPGIEVELAGKWLWVSGQTYPIKDELKKADFKFASKKKMWYYPGVEAGGRGNFSITDIRNKYGSVTLKTTKQEQLNGTRTIDKKKLVQSFKKIKAALRKRKVANPKLQKQLSGVMKKITVSQIKEGAKFKTRNGIIWIIDEIKNDLVRTSMEGGKKGNYRDDINEVVSFLNDEKSYPLSGMQSTPNALIKSMKGKGKFQPLQGLGTQISSHPIPINQTAKKIMLKILAAMGGKDHKKFDASGGVFMPLSVEVIGQTDMGREISLAHYYEQNGDLMADPEMIFLEKNGEFYPAYYKQAGLGLEKYSIKYNSEKMVGYNRALQKDQTQFANMWLKNIKDQQEL